MNDAVPGVFSVFISEGGVRSKVPTPCSTMQLWPRHWVSGPELSWAAYHDHDHGNQTLDESAPLNDWLGQTTLDTDLVCLYYITSWMERFHCFEGNDAPIWYWNSTCPAPEVLLMCWHLCFILACFTFHCSSGANSAESLQSCLFTLHYTACCTGETKIRFPICFTSDKKLKASGILQHKSLLLLYKTKIKPNKPWQNAKIHCNKRKCKIYRRFRGIEILFWQSTI